MDKILLLTEELKDLIIKSDEYKEFDKCKKIIDNNEEIKEIINKIKEKQKVVINKEYKKISKDKEEFELQNLFKKLNSFDDYNNYITSAKKLNILLTEIKKEFEEYFNSLINI